MAQFKIGPYTKEVLSNRTDDYRIDFLYDALFGDNIRNVIKESEINAVLRHAMLGDLVDYLMVQDKSTMQSTLEKNIANINKLIQGESTLPIRRTWIIVFFYSEEKKSVDMNVYSNPNSQDCKDMLSNTPNLMASVTIIEYDTPETLKLIKENGLNQETIDSIPSPLLNFILIAPLYENNANEYEKFSKEIESEILKNVFWIDFSKKKKK